MLVTKESLKGQKTSTKRRVRFELQTSEEIPLAVSQPEPVRPPRKASLAVKDLVQKMVRNQFEDSDEESAGLGSEEDEHEEVDSEEDKGDEGEGEEGEDEEGEDEEGEDEEDKDEVDEDKADKGKADEVEEDALSDEGLFALDPELKAFLNEKPAEIPPKKSKDKASKKKGKKPVVKKPQPESEDSDAESGDSDEPGEHLSKSLFVCLLDEPS
jgi:hypothetical protein